MNHQNCANQHNNNLTKRTDSTKKDPTTEKMKNNKLNMKSHIHMYMYRKHESLTPRTAGWLRITGDSCHSVANLKLTSRTSK